MTWIPFAVACFLLGSLFGAVVGGSYVLKELDRRQREAYRRLRELHRERA